MRVIERDSLSSIANVMGGKMKVRRVRIVQDVSRVMARVANQQPLRGGTGRWTGVRSL